MSHKLNYIILSDGNDLYLFERLNKNVPFDAYNKDLALCTGSSVDEILENSPVPVWELEKQPYEVIFNE